MWHAGSTCARSAKRATLSSKSSRYHTHSAIQIASLGCRHDKEDGHSYVEGAVKSSRGNRDEVGDVYVCVLHT